MYQGDELAMANAPFTAITDYRDIETLRFYAQAAERPGADLPALLAAIAKMSRDQGRTPVQRHASPGAGFTTGTPWLAVNPDHTTVNAAAQIGDPGSVFEHYRRRIAPRHEAPVVTQATSSCSCRTTPRSGPSSAAPPRPSCWSRPTSPPTAAVRLPLDADRLGPAWTPLAFPPSAAAAARPQAPPLGVRRLAPELASRVAWPAQSRGHDGCTPPPETRGLSGGRVFLGVRRTESACR